MSDPQAPEGASPTTAHPPLHWLRAVDHPQLMAPATHAALVAWSAVDPDVSDGVAVAEIDPHLADTAALTQAYGLPLGTSANCVVVSGRRAGEERIAAAVVLATTRADVNNAVKRLLDVRKASFLPTDRATAESSMEYGGITPVGLPSPWRVLVDARVVVADAEHRADTGDGADRGDGADGGRGADGGPARHPAVIIGSGIRGSKLSLPGALLGRMPGVEVVEDLAIG